MKTTTTADKEERLYYLSDEDIIVAKGALQIFPDLEKQNDKQRKKERKNYGYICALPWMTMVSLTFQ
jgi:hypothetical protein